MTSAEPKTIREIGAELSFELAQLHANGALRTEARDAVIDVFMGVLARHVGSVVINDPDRAVVPLPYRDGSVAGAPGRSSVGPRRYRTVRELAGELWAELLDREEKLLSWEMQSAVIDPVMGVLARHAGCLVANDPDRPVDAWPNQAWAWCRRQAVELAEALDARRAHGEAERVRRAALDATGPEMLLALRRQLAEIETMADRLPRKLRAKLRSLAEEVECKLEP